MLAAVSKDELIVAMKVQTQLLVEGTVKDEADIMAGEWVSNAVDQKYYVWLETVESGRALAPPCHHHLNVVKAKVFKRAYPEPPRKQSN